jgi:anaerobic magnesium-protoporphyrin IX monomethyl ester cyclase
MMNILFLNIPNREQITRRYMCSYVSNESLLPPLELISLASIAELLGHEVSLLDAIAEKKDNVETTEKIKEINPSIIVSLTGFECFEEDLDFIKDLKKSNPTVKIILFGHYPTHFPYETLLNSDSDFVLQGESELTFKNLLIKLSEENKCFDDVDGLCYLREGELVQIGSFQRVNSFVDLPLPSYHLLPINSYYEPLLPKPFAMVQSVRGCPYQCNYCVKSFGTKTTVLKPEDIILHIKELKQLFNINSLRFIDDTFTFDKERVINICKLIIEEKLKIDWTCLSRPDNLNEEMLIWMKKAGCKRIYLGVETGSQKMLDIYKKRINREEAIQKIQLCKKIGIQSAAFLMIGHPMETEKDIDETLSFILESKVNLISVSPLTPYPGTSLFKELSGEIDFNIYPYKNQWKENSIGINYLKRSERINKSFYMRFSFIKNNVGLIILNPFNFLKLSLRVFIESKLSGRLFFGGIKPHNNK